MPYNLTFSLTSRCNSRCKTCNINQVPRQELTREEWGRVFKSLGKRVFWATLSGGEPFLRDDICDIAKTLYDKCRPRFINIPTNGLLGQKIVDAVKSIADYCRKSSLVVNLSLDQIGQKHDLIRGVSGNYDRTVRTFAALKRLKQANLSVGIHSVISSFNVADFPEVYEQLYALSPDSLITEIAEERAELSTVGSKITPEASEYSRLVDFLLHRLSSDTFAKAGMLTRALRSQYYQLAREILAKKKQVIPCYAGYASAQVAADGDIWFCCVQAKAIGNIKNADYDFKSIWFSSEADWQRKLIRQGKCYCPLANAAYTNMLHSPRCIMRILGGLLKRKR